MNLSMITSELRLLPDPSLYGGPDLRAEAGRMASDRFGRLQHYGTGNSLSKYIYVDSFESTRWTSSGERVVKVVE